MVATMRFELTLYGFSNRSLCQLGYVAKKVGLLRIELRNTRF